MLNIYVLEDHYIQQDRIEELIEKVIAKSSFKVGKLEIFDKPDQLLSAVTERGAHQLFFLDIQIKGYEKMGLEVAKELRAKDPYCNIVFFTTHSEFLPITFQYQLAALDFIDKSLDDEHLVNQIETVLALVQKKTQSQGSEDAFRITNSKTALQVPFHDILYFETSDVVHKVILHTKEEQIEFYGSLAQIEKNDPRLFKCHKSFIVNPENIIKLEKAAGTAHFENGGVCYVSKLKQKKLIEKMGL